MFPKFQEWDIDATGPEAELMIHGAFEFKNS
jgi:hypothetical protein